MILMDGDDDRNGTQVINNYPGSNNNHGAEGTNVGFLDGHVEWVATGKQPSTGGQALWNVFVGGYYNPGWPCPPGCKNPW